MARPHTWYRLSARWSSTLTSLRRVPDLHGDAIRQISSTEMQSANAYLPASSTGLYPSADNPSGEIPPGKMRAAALSPSLRAGAVRGDRLCLSPADRPLLLAHLLSEPTLHSWRRRRRRRRRRRARSWSRLRRRTPRRHWRAQWRAPPAVERELSSFLLPRSRIAAVAACRLPHLLQLLTVSVSLDTTPQPSLTLAPTLSPA